MTVATETGRWPFDLLDTPVHELLYVFHHLSERDARRAVVERAARVDLGVMTALAFNQPERLDDEIRSVREAIDAVEYEAPAVNPARLRAEGLALAQRIRAGQVLDPRALLPTDDAEPVN